MLVIFCWNWIIDALTVQSEHTNTMYSLCCCVQLFSLFLQFQEDKNKIYELFRHTTKKHLNSASVLFIPTHNYISDPNGTIPIS